ncbi:hypothetical protein NMG60_11029802 [Bertholletia excelsa]
MKGYSDALIPPLTEFSPPAHGLAIDEKGSSSRKRGRDLNSKMPLKARDSREKMTEKFSLLQSIVPNLPPKATKERIVTGTIQHIQRLEEEVQRLERLKESPGTEQVALTHFQTLKSGIDLTICRRGGGLAFFGIQVAHRRRVVTDILRVFEKKGTEVMAAGVAAAGHSNVHCGHRMVAVTVTALVGGGDEVVENIKRELLNL